MGTTSPYVTLETNLLVLAGEPALGRARYMPAGWNGWYSPLFRYEFTSLWSI